MDLLKEAKAGFVVTATAFIALGIVLCAWPMLAAGALCVIAGIALILAGAWKVIGYFRKGADQPFRFDFIAGVFEIIFAVVLICRPALVVTAFPLMLSILLLADGIIKLQVTVELCRARYPAWWQSLIACLICCFAAVILMLNPFASASLLMTLIGASFIANGVVDLWTTLYISRKFRAFVEKR